MRLTRGRCELNGQLTKRETAGFALFFVLGRQHADWIASMSERTAQTPVVEKPKLSGFRRPAPAVLIVGILFIAMIGISVWYLSRR